MVLRSNHTHPAFLILKQYQFILFVHISYNAFIPSLFRASVILSAFIHQTSALLPQPSSADQSNFVRNFKPSLFIGGLGDNAIPLEFEGFRKEAGLNAFTLSPTRWIEATNAIGIISQTGRYGGTFAQTERGYSVFCFIST